MTYQKSMTQISQNSDINPSDKTSLLAFFAKYNKLSENDQAMIAGKSTHTIRRWKRICGLSKNKKPLYEKISYRKKLNRVNEDWDNPEWFYKMYHENGYGIRQIAFMIDKAIRTVEKRLSKYNIKTRSHKDSTKSKNKFANKEWLQRHYVELKWSLDRCAIAACVTKATIVDWLVAFRIFIRD